MPSQRCTRGICIHAVRYMKAARSLYHSSRPGWEPCATTAVRNPRCGAVRSKTRKPRVDRHVSPGPARSRRSTCPSSRVLIRMRSGRWSNNMIGGKKAIGVVIMTATVISGLVVPAYSQGLGKKGGGYDGPPAENHPKIDEKAYKAALDRIPDPVKKYDPWGIARPSDSAAAPGKSN
jgi:hypothetical protein